MRNQRFVFNIKGNDYRLVALIKFKIKMVYIRFIGTHRVDVMRDLVPVCPNCHAMLHRDSNSTMDIEELKQLIECRYE